jgi:hypothetical protein
LELAMIHDDDQERREYWHDIIRLIVGLVAIAVVTVILGLLCGCMADRTANQFAREFGTSLGTSISATLVDKLVVGSGAAVPGTAVAPAAANPASPASAMEYDVGAMVVAALAALTSLASIVHRYWFHRHTAQTSDIETALNHEGRT